MIFTGSVDTGKKVWTHEYTKTPNWGSMLTTGGGLVFTGGTNDRKIHAFDASTGKLLWEHQTSSGIVAPPSTFTVNGKQYVAVTTGNGGGSPRVVPRTPHRLRHRKTHMQKTHMQPIRIKLHTRLPRPQWPLSDRCPGS